MFLRGNIFGIATLTMTGLVGAAQAATIIPVPLGLQPGSTYRLIFVTNTSMDATSSNIATYNAFVQSAANSIPELSSLGATWKAIVSTLAVNAVDKTLVQTQVKDDSVCRSAYECSR